MNGIIIYKSQYGSTMQYAKWIGEKTGFPVVTEKEINISHLSEYDKIILGSAIIGYKLILKDWIIKNWDKIKNKNIFLFTVSGAPPDKKEIMQKFLDNSLSKDIQKNIKYFPLHGKMVFKKLPIVIQILLKMVGSMQKNPEVKKNFTKDYNHLSKENIIPLISSILNSLEWKYLFL